MVTGRFAPTPSGELHAGNILCALLAYLSAKSSGGRFLVRIEDLDRERCPESTARAMLSALTLLGLGGDEEPVWQSRRTEAYRKAENKLRSCSNVYPCYCSRAELHAAHAPRTSDGDVVYSGKCRMLSASEAEEKSSTRKPCFRIEVPDREIAFTDKAAGEYSQNLARDCGDFILRRSDGVYAYQLAVAVDDCESGVTEVVRGRDLLASTPRQLWLMEKLGYTTPVYYHIPLVCDSRGRKLSKSEGDCIMRAVERTSPEYVIGELAFAAGITNRVAEKDARSLIPLFDWQKVPRSVILLPPDFDRNN